MDNTRDSDYLGNADVSALKKGASVNQHKGLPHTEVKK